MIVICYNKIMAKDYDAFFSSMAAIFVLFTAMISPTVAVIIALLALVGFSTYKLSFNKDKGWTKSVATGIIASVIIILYFTAIHDILKGSQNTYVWEYLTLILSVLLIALFIPVLRKAK